MGPDPYPWSSVKKRQLWQCFNPFEAANNMLLRNPGHHLVTDRWVFGAAARVNPLKQQVQQTSTAGCGAIPGSVRQLDAAFSKPPHITSADVHATEGGSRPPERQFLIFDQSGNRTTMIFSSVSPASQAHGDTTDLVGKLKADAVNISDETTYVSQRSKPDEADDIDALLYSDSEEEEANAAALADTSSPDNKAVIIPAADVMVVEEEVASSGGPSKRRRLDDGEMDDEALMDTASSVTDKADNVPMPTTTTSCCEEHTSTSNRNGDDNGDQSSCIKGVTSCSSPKWATAGVVAADLERNNQQPAVSKAGGSSSSSMWKVKRDQIYETVGVLRGVIPGCKGKDACLVLDEAIRYLKSLELKVQSLGGGVI